MREFLSEFIQRGMRAVMAGLDLNRRDSFFLGNQKINLYVVFTVIAVISRIERVKISGEKSG